MKTRISFKESGFKVQVKFWLFGRWHTTKHVFSSYAPAQHFIEILENLHKN
ncbi:hypothetical protein ACM55H_11645 [Flavobacterium sp. ZT3R17]|uniref:hypothetical protein n=1 Tax=Flavobacterium cryoconiti TaxID=3398736 RepID=UPI003A8786F4